jgi:dTDP-4-dehydrorhamnose reductase
MVVAAIKELKLLLGSTGMLGHALQRVFPDALFLGHADLDITNKRGVQELIKHEHPAVVINAAAYTDVDGCEDNRDHAFAVNGYGPGYLAEACAETGSVLVHFSTDYIFDGTRSSYREDDTPNPINAYGESKLLGEVSIRENMDDHRIVRTSWLFGPHGKNFVDTILALSRSMEVVRVVKDQIGRPTYTVDLARAMPGIISRAPGVYHITNEGQCSWYDFARAFIPNAVPCTTEEFPRRAKRPAYSVLLNTKTPLLRHWREAVADYLRSKEGT